MGSSVQSKARPKRALPPEPDAGPKATPRMRAPPVGPAPLSSGALSLRLASSRARSKASLRRFGLALDWTDEPTDLAPPPQNPSREPAGRSGDTSIDIAAELGLSAALTLDQLTSCWRDFVWRNHPDRQPVAARERANRRVAIANTLYDRARRERDKVR